MNRELFLLAGETSGDDRGAELIHALLKKDPTLKISGMGGPRMKSAGMEVIIDITNHAVVGILEVIKRYPFFKKIFDRLLSECIRRKPLAVVGIDYPGFNLRFEKAARKHLGGDTSIIHYVSPQLWAWNEKRKHKMAEFLDLVLCIFPFEPKVYSGTGLRAEYVGHPLLKKIDFTPPDQRDPHLILLMPGSRKNEIKHHWPVFQQVVRQLASKRPELQFVVGTNTGKTFPGFSSGDPTKLMQTAQMGLVASGTATLEACLHGLPMLVVYKVFPPTYWLGKHLVKVPHLAMPNVIADSEIVPEFIQNRCTAHQLVPALEKLLDSPVERKNMTDAYGRIRSILGEKNAAENAADLILNTLNQRF